SPSTNAPRSRSSEPKAMCSATIARRSSVDSAVSASRLPWIRNRNRIEPSSVVFRKTNAQRHHRRMLERIMSIAADLRAAPLEERLTEARRLRPGRLVTSSPKVFVPLPTLCRDVCGYCTFARPPRRGERAFLSEDEVLAIARAGQEAGCREALF